MKDTEKSEGFFGKLPFFQPWAWKLLAVVGTVSFIVGFAIAAWADYTLTK